MLFMIGLVVVLGSIIGGYTMHHGDLKVLWQPNEFIIIIGSAIGSGIIGNPSFVLKHTLHSFKCIFKARPKSKADYMELLKVAFSIFKLMKTKGMLEIESHVENPNESELFNKAPSLLADHASLDFIRDYLRMMTMGVDQAYVMDDLITKEIDIFSHESGIPGKVVATIADSFPALGIVAAVLGVITTMGSITEPPEVLGKLIGAALVGTFVGVLLSYGIVGPIGNYINTYEAGKVEFLECIKAGLMSHLNGNPPVVTIEFMRKHVPEGLRPTFYEVDEELNGAGNG